MITLLTYLKARKSHYLYSIAPEKWWTLLALDIAGVCLILITISMIWVAFGWKI